VFQGEGVFGGGDGWLSLFTKNAQTARNKTSRKSFPRPSGGGRRREPTAAERKDLPCRINLGKANYEERELGDPDNARCLYSDMWQVGWNPYSAKVRACGKA